MSSVRRSEKQTLHFGHCHLLHFSTTHTSPPLFESCTTSKRTTPPPRNFHSNNSPERVEETWQNTSKTPSVVGQRRTRRSRNVAGTQSGGNILRTLPRIAQRKNYLFASCSTGQEIRWKNEKARGRWQNFLGNRFRGLATPRTPATFEARLEQEQRFFPNDDQPPVGNNTRWGRNKPDL